MPKISDGTMDGKIDGAFDLMHEGKSIRSTVLDLRRVPWLQ